MAVTITQYPPTLAMAQSPIVYALNDADATGTGYKYRVDVYVWRGAFGSFPPSSFTQHTLYRPPAPNLRAHFDISTLLAQDIQLEYTKLFPATPIINAGGQVINIRIAAGNNTTANQAQSSTTWAAYGYAGVYDGINANKSTANPLTMQPETIYMAAGVWAIMPGWYSTLFHGFRQTVSGTQELYDYATDVSAVTDSADKVLYFGIGSKQVADRYGAALPETYTIDILNDEPSPVKTYTVNIVCSRYPVYTIYFINRFGFWDFLCCYGNNTEGVSTAKDSYMRQNIYWDDLENGGTYGIKSDPAAATHRTYNSRGNTTIKLNTGWHDEGIKELIKDIALSPYVMVCKDPVSQVAIPVKVNTESINYKTHISDGLINYTLDMMIAHEEINSIR